MRILLRKASTASTIVAWLVQIYAAVIPHGPNVSEHLGRLTLLIAGTGTLAWLFRRIMAPAHELYAAGKMAGRIEALAERDDGVASLDERRALRIVSKF